MRSAFRQCLLLLVDALIWRRKIEPAPRSAGGRTEPSGANRDLASQLGAANGLAKPDVGEGLQLCSRRGSMIHSLADCLGDAAASSGIGKQEEQSRGVTRWFVVSAPGKSRRDPDRIGAADRRIAATPLVLCETKMARCAIRISRPPPLDAAQRDRRGPSSHPGKRLRILEEAAVDSRMIPDDVGKSIWKPGRGHFSKSFG